MSANVRILCVIINLVGEEREGSDIRKKVDHAIPSEEVHVTVQVEILCCFVHLMCLSDKLDNDEQRHECTECNLNSAYDLGQNGGTDSLHAKRKVKHLTGNSYVYNWARTYPVIWYA